jgi:hypothetical protein
MSKNASTFATDPRNQATMERIHALTMNIAQIYIELARMSPLEQEVAIAMLAAEGVKLARETATLFNRAADAQSASKAAPEVTVDTN